MWAVMLSKKGGYECYAIVTTEACARQWAECLEHGGSDTAICSIDKDMIIEAAESLRK